jgi:hypothetical protein
MADLQVLYLTVWFVTLLFLETGALMMCCIIPLHKKIDECERLLNENLQLLQNAVSEESEEEEEADAEESEEEADDEESEEEEEEEEDDDDDEESEEEADAEESEVVVPTAEAAEAPAAEAEAPAAEAEAEAEAEATGPKRSKRDSYVINQLLQVQQETADRNKERKEMTVSELIASAQKEITTYMDRPVSYTKTIEGKEYNFKIFTKNDTEFWVTSENDAYSVEWNHGDNDYIGNYIGKWDSIDGGLVIKEEPSTSTVNV